MGTVFEAEDLALQRTVAVKLLSGVQTTDRGFLREARALSRLRHHGIVRLYDAGADQGDAYLVLELVRGQCLRELLEDGPMDPGKAATIGRELAEALAHAHSLGVVHRDLSPGNVLIDETGRVRLADFGIARLSEATATVGGEVWGTPAFMAPEQVAGDPVGPAADVYSLGLVLLEALTGERAFPGSPTEAGFARLSRDPHVPDSLPGGWAPLLRSMTSREPGDRPYAVSVASRLGAPREVLRTLAMPAMSAMPADTSAAAASARASAVTSAAAAPAAAASAPVASTRPMTSAYAAPAVLVPWWRRPAAALTGLLVTAALLMGLAMRSDQPGIPEALATGAPAASVSPTATPTSTPAPAPPPPGEEEDEDDDNDEGKGKGKGKKGD